MLRPIALLLLLALFTGCAAPPPEPDPIRRALQNLSDRAVARVMDVDALQPTQEQVLLLVTPEVDASLEIGSERFLESLTRALLAASDGPQVLDWRPAMSGEGGDHQWRMESRLEATAPRLTLSDRDLLPYRLILSLYRPDAESALWETEIEGAFDATAL
ncbi:hypothetical protein HOP62_15100 [Halomonas sp. MCCC 1A17488]|uniref:hypothetical protein n=1 Tax=unclassified Halomonas TaxID=2609666 RepID=UPI0018D24406|nr:MULTISPECIES: hypothetical protein [unclassified Halomonas]MCE8017404.1 hypothetical protein [Halomonas sp. MCCC 1A17488]MCG3240737.1 hypothetical protein [Halomonas sp. MCCC 1A17488]QPP49425.1 hypothetical protein I4484_20040 [Halomonas sp. SS10-MC5]